MKPSSTRRLVCFGKQPAPHFFILATVSGLGGNAFHFSCLLSDMIYEMGRAPSMPTSKIYIPGESPWSYEMVFTVPKDSKGEVGVCVF